MVENPPMFAIAIPHRGDLRADFVKSLFHLIKPKEGFLWFDHEGSPPDAARNRMTVRALQQPTPFDAMLFIDDDMVLAPSTLSRLWTAMRDSGADVVSALYFGRTAEAIPMAYRYHKFDATKEAHWYKPIGQEVADYLKKTPGCLPPPGDDPGEWTYSAWDCFPQELVDVDGVGFGCVLVRPELLRKMGAPWFAGDPLTGGGEDFFFCRKARALGARIVVDLGIQCGHASRGDYVGRLDFADTWAVATADEFDWGEGVESAVMQMDPWGRLRVAGNSRQDNVVVREYAPDMTFEPAGMER